MTRILMFVATITGCINITEAAHLPHAQRLTTHQLTQPPPPPPEPLPPHHDTWLQLAECESGGDWGINTGNGYSGGVQFAPTSWRAAGGTQYAEYAYQASMLEQMWTAETLLDMQGWSAWPTCSRRIGIR